MTAFRSLDVPVLYMVGKRSTPSAHGVARLLATALPQVELVEFEHLGHMGPVTHPDLVNEVILQFLERTHGNGGCADAERTTRPGHAPVETPARMATATGIAA